MKSNLPILAIVVPCYNEEEVLSITLQELLLLCNRLKEKGLIEEDIRIYFIDDGSQDRTWFLIEQFANTQVSVHGIKLSRNRGHQNAVLAGLYYAEGDIIVTIDADLQDDIGVVQNMVVEYLEGKDIVYGVRIKRATDSWFKRVSAEGYYRLLSLMGVNIIINHADFRLMSRRAVEALKEYGEVNLFLRGIVPTIGFPFSIVYYDRHERMAGESKYPFRKMLALAIDGITSFSTAPLRIITGIGLLTFVISMLLTGWVLWIRFFTDEAIPGWASLTLPVYFVGGIQLLSIGILGEYVAKIYLETKRRPRFFVEKII